MRSALLWLKLFFVASLAVAGMAFSGSARAQEELEDGAVLDVQFTATPRAQIAIWIESGDGRFLRTLALTDAVAYRGIGNRPGASEMNSGYRWPYGRREGVLPIWATRRAASQGAEPFKRVIFQVRQEGHASQGPADQSADNYFCLSFARENATRDALDAVSCASTFNSDKGRFITSDDIDDGYAEPFETAPGQGVMQPLPLDSLYPPRMDVDYCHGDGCYDHIDIDGYRAHAREVMPEIDAVSMATPPGNVPQSLLYTLTNDWPKGDYIVWVEVAVEGDYNASFDATSFPTPETPDDTGQWDYWALTYGYPYRGQPSIAYAVPITLGEPGTVGESTSQPAGASSWDVWDEDFGQLGSLDDITDNHEDAPGSGADRLVKDEDGVRLRVVAEVLDLHEPEPGEEPFMPMEVDPTVDEEPPVTGDGDVSGDGDGDGDVGGEGDGNGDGDGDVGGDGDDPTQNGGKGGSGDPPADGGDSAVGKVTGLVLAHHPNKLRSHTWVEIQFRAPESERPIHRYEVRYATTPITDEETFIREGRAAKTATDDAEGAVALMLPTTAAPGQRVQGDIGDLMASTEYWIAVRAVDRRNRKGPIAVATISTTQRTFATVTPCFIATAAYGSTLAPQVGVLRRFRDRYLMPSELGRAVVDAYYATSPVIAEQVRSTPWLASAVRVGLWPFLTLSRWLE